MNLSAFIVKVVGLVTNSLLGASQLGVSPKSIDLVYCLTDYYSYYNYHDSMTAEMH